MVRPHDRRAAPGCSGPGAIEKAYADLGADFFDVRRGMPLVAQYVAEEGRKHNCTNPKDLYPRYLAHPRDLQEVSA